jgi:hypothetical protein
MSKMPLDLSKFRKVGTDQHKTRLKHIDGHDLTIAHAKLSPKLKTQLDKLPMADGGAVAKSPDQPWTQQDKKDFSKGASEGDVSLGQAVQNAKKALGFAHGGNVQHYANGTADAEAPDTESDQADGAQDQEEQEQPQQAQQPNVSAAQEQAANNIDQGPGPAVNKPKVNQDPFGMMAGLEQQQHGIEQVGAGQEAEQQALASQAKQNLPQEQAYQGTLAKAADAYAGEMKRIQGEHSKFLQDHNNGYIDTHRYINGMSTGDKIRTGIGLILGGMGAGLTHGPNLAFNYLQNQINQDIDAQKTDVNSHFHYNLQQTKNAQEAYNMTKFQANEVLASHLRVVADQTADPLAKARIMQIGGMTEQNMSQLAHQMAMMKMQQAAFSGQGGAGNPMVMESLQPEMRKRAVQLPDGSMRLAYSDKGAEEMRQQIQTMQPIFSQLDRLEKLGPSALVSGSPANQEAKAIQSQLIPLVNENAGLKRLSSEDIGNIKQMFKDPTKFSGQIAGGTRTKMFKQFLQDKMMGTMQNQLEGGAPMQRQAPAAGSFGFKPRKG